MRKAVLVAASAAALIWTSPTLAQPVDPVLQTMIGSVQLFVNEYQRRSEALDKANQRLVELERELGCWRSTGKTCPPSDKEGKN